MSEQRLTTVSHIRTLRGSEASVRAALDALAGPSLAESGCLGYDVFADTADPRHFVVVAGWASPAAIEEHVGLQHVATFRAATAGALEGDLETSVLTAIG